MMIDDSASEIDAQFVSGSLRKTSCVSTGICFCLPDQLLDVVAFHNTTQNFYFRAQFTNLLPPFLA